MHEKLRVFVAVMHQNPYFISYNRVVLVPVIMPGTSKTVLRIASPRMSLPVV